MVARLWRDTAGKKNARLKRVSLLHVETCYRVIWNAKRELRKRMQHSLLSDIYSVSHCKYYVGHSMGTTWYLQCDFQQSSQAKRLGPN
jgi:hypothetical protein